jgi:hypothetical protein
MLQSNPYDWRTADKLQAALDATEGEAGELARLHQHFYDCAEHDGYTAPARAIYRGVAAEIGARIQAIKESKP